MRIINEAIPPAAVPIVARTLIEAHGKAVSKGYLISRAQSLAQHGEPLDYGAALRTLILRGLVLAGSDGYSPVPGREKLLTYYANSACG
jgi:hypothetical protein